MNTKIMLPKPLYQWDIGAVVRLAGDIEPSEVELHFASPFGGAAAYVVQPREESGATVADVPNLLTQTPGRLCIYLCERGTGKRITAESCTVQVIPRKKPDDYVYTETEVDDYRTLAGRVEALEQGGVGDAAQSDWAQNDAAAPDYVRNRPGGYIEEGATVLDGTVTFSDNGFAYDPVFGVNLIVGSTYRVTVDGVVYTRTAVEYPELDPNVVCISDNPLIVDGVQSDPGSFLIMCEHNYVMMILLPGNTVDGTAHEITVVGDTVRQIDKRYMPGEIPTVYDLEEYVSVYNGSVTDALPSWAVVRNIRTSTTDLIAGQSDLVTGQVYLVYE